MDYKNEPWYALLAGVCKSMRKVDVATALGISAPLLSQVMNGSGKYGTGQASTANLAERVVHTFGRYTCPHMTEQQGKPTEVTADQCRSHAHREPPTGSPRDMQFWQACNACPHKAHTAPPVAREVKPRKASPAHNPQEPV